MSEFIEECRREWKRLGVPDPIANEMAADLAADLREAEADGASAEEVLGNGAFDPRTFAATWANERGVTQTRSSGKTRWRRVLLGLVALALALAAIAFSLSLATSTKHAPNPAATVRQPTTTVATTRVPDLIGLGQEQAITAAKAAGLAVRVSLRKHGSLPAGTVLEQAPAAGNILARGATVTLIVAKK